jgi:hypothetical protein
MPSLMCFLQASEKGLELGVVRLRGCKALCDGDTLDAAVWTRMWTSAVRSLATSSGISGVSANNSECLAIYSIRPATKQTIPAHWGA